MTSTKWLLVLPPYGGARSVALHTAQAFKELLPSDQFKCFDAGKYLKGFQKLIPDAEESVVVDLLNQTFIVSCFDFQPTHCLVGALAPITLFSLSILQKNNILTGIWFYEDYRKASYIDRVLSGYDHLFAIQRGSFISTICAKHNKTSFHFLPTAAGSTSLQYNETERSYDFVFIGISSPYRIKILEYIVLQGFSGAVAGSSWSKYDGGILDSHIKIDTWCNEYDAFSLMVQSKVGLNLSIEDPVNRSDIHISPRIFDYAAAGCLIVTEDVPLLYDSFPDGIYKTFTDIKHCAEQISHLCSVSDNGKKDRVTNRTIVLTRHQYIHRVQTIIKYMSE